MSERFKTPGSDRSAADDAGAAAPLSLGALLRAAADGELSAAQQAQLDRLLAEHPGHAARIRFEHDLRRAVGRASASDAQPSPALRGAIQAMVVAASDREAAAAPLAIQSQARSQEARAHEAWAERTRQPSFWARAARGLAAAAVLALAALAAYTAGRVSTPSGVEYATRATDFLADEHGRCLRDMAHADRKLVLDDAASVPAEMRRVVGLEVDLNQLLSTPGIRFVDGGRCALPGAESLHLRLETSDAAGVTKAASLWVQRDTGRLTLAPGKCYRLTGEPADPTRPCVFAWRGQGVVFWLVCDRAEFEALRTALAAPAMAGASL